MMKNNSTTIILLVCVMFVVCSTQMRLYCILCWISESRSSSMNIFIHNVKQTTTGTAFCSVPPIIFARVVGCFASHPPRPSKSSVYIKYSLITNCLLSLYYQPGTYHYVWYGRPFRFSFYHRCSFFLKILTTQNSIRYHYADDILQLTTPRTFISTLLLLVRAEERPEEGGEKRNSKKNNYYFNYKRNQQFIIETIIVQPPLLHAAASFIGNIYIIIKRTIITRQPFGL